MPAHQLTNRLAQSASPYLRQHKDNPVHWQPWDADALAEAKRQNKPILLSVGYSACHWCHVMAHESFESDTVAALMNEHFINIKVDREERPDLDAIYQGALHLMGEQGGWPLTMFLTPDAEPFFGGTYFPPEPRYGRPGFPQVLLSLSEAYHGRHEDVLQNVAAIRSALHEQSAAERGAGFDENAIARAGEAYLQAIDWARGGTQGAPKFPQPPIFGFLWRLYHHSQNTRYRDAVILTLDHMCQGGIWDHAGGGFARYSTDEVWLAPHFEKMLYDNALLIDLLADAWKVTRKPLYKERIGEIVQWLEREMMVTDDNDNKGGDSDPARARRALAAALDADSEGVEGKFYVWSEAGVDAALKDVDEKTRSLFKRAYDVRPNGNWEGHVILNRSSYMDAAGAEAEAGFRRCLDALLAARAVRPRPGRDDKVLADWNAMTIAALARAGALFDRPAWVRLAEDAFAFVAHHLRDQDGRLAHSWCAGQPGYAGVLDDYAQMARAGLALYEATGTEAYLDAAVLACDIAHALFWDDDAGGYFFTARDVRDVILRTKTANDTVTPSGNGVMAEVLVALYHLTGDDLWRTRADDLFAATAPDDARATINMPGMAAAWLAMAAAPTIVIVGAAGAARAALWRAALEAGAPGRTISVLDEGVALSPDHPAHGRGAIDGRPAAYVCRAGTCGLPLTDAGSLRDALTGA